MDGDSRPHLKIAWWNVANFYHFDANKVGSIRSRWPQSLEEFQGKLKNVVQALEELNTFSGKPDVLFLCEITSVAATALRDALFPNYRLISLDVKKNEPTLQLAVIYDSSRKDVVFSEEPPITVSATPGGTRPMIVLDAAIVEAKVRFVGCHWQSRFDEHQSDRIRFRLADHLAKYTYEFLQENIGMHHVVVIGDLNEEPFENNLGALYAHRSRERSKVKSHHTDHDVQRVHLYNTSWRLLGEKIPHPAKINDQSFGNCAGTFYWESQRSWHHFDHIIVSGGLLKMSTPYFDENELHIASLPSFLTNGLPLKFHQKDGVYCGVSDHLPIIGKIYI